MGELWVLFFILQISALILMVRCSSLSGLRVELTHVDSDGNFSKFELLRRAAMRSSHRVARLTSGHSAAEVKAAAPGSSSQVEAPVHPGNGEFLMDLAIGTPSLAYSAILDTGSDLIWTQCKPCLECFSQPTAVFDPSNSSTYKKLPCSGDLCQALPTSRCATSACEYLYTYGDSSSTQGVLASETFGFGGGANATAVPGVAFGCGDTNQGSGFTQAGGIVGLGRGPLSLISQLGLGKFSYCLTSFNQSKKSPLLFGSLADLSAGEAATAVQTIPLLKNPQQPSFYYLPLKGITVGGTRLQIPSSAFALQDDGTGGVIIDSGTSITYLVAAGYRQVKRAFLNQVQLPVADGSDVGLDVCFSLPAESSSVEVPKLTFNFDGADLDLPAENYIIADSSTGLLCLTIMGSRGLSIIGNFQQQNLHVLYDLKEEALSFVSAQCDTL
ncbi:aspartic proteinase nepenthesin-1-like [Zingiber officinale]|nr:aspartic proteinase nepenthesin-1-like [Zingiber officinale]